MTRQNLILRLENGSNTPNETKNWNKTIGLFGRMWRRVFNRYPSLLTLHGLPKAVSIKPKTRCVLLKSSSLGALRPQNEQIHISPNTACPRRKHIRSSQGQTNGISKRMESPHSGWLFDFSVRPSQSKKPKTHEATISEAKIDSASDIVQQCSLTMFGWHSVQASKRTMLVWKCGWDRGFSLSTQHSLWAF